MVCWNLITAKWSVLAREYQHFRAIVNKHKIKLMPTFKAALLYFLMVFGAGFLLGPIRIFLLVPKVGIRAAELFEMPIMLAAMFCAARQTNAKFLLPPTSRLAASLIALTLMLTAELTVAVTLRDLTIREAFLSRDPISGGAYYASLILFALLLRVLPIRLS